MARIEATGLGKSFRARRAVDDLTFTVRPGVVTGFLGPNGSGKSTTMRLMLGLDRGEGRTTFDGVEMGHLRRPATQVGALLEARAFHPTRRARQHLRMIAAANGIGERRVDEVLGLVGLESVAKGRPKTFSLGMAQRLGIAAALVGDPHTLVLDEPTNGLDPQGITWLRSLLKHLAGEGRSVFVSSHLLAEMAQLADELVVIGRGRLLASGPMAEFIDGSGAGTVRVRTPSPGDLPARLEQLGATVTVEDGELVVQGLAADQVGDLAHELGVRLHQLATVQATLEEAFLSTTGLSEEFQASPEGPR